MEREPDNSGKPGGTHKVDSVERCWGKQQYITSHVYQERWGALLHHESWLPRYAKALNQHHLEAVYEKCPWGGGCNTSTYLPYLRGAVDPL